MRSVFQGEWAKWRVRCSYGTQYRHLPVKFLVVEVGILLGVCRLIIDEDSRGRQVETENEFEGKVSSTLIKDPRLIV